MKVTDTFGLVRRIVRRISRLRNVVAILCLILTTWSAGGCLNYYYKQFDFGGKPHYPNEGMFLDSVFWGVQIDVEPVDERTYQSTSYELWLCASTYYAGKCDERWRTFFESLEVKNLELQFADTGIAPKLDSTEHFAPCQYYWYYERVTIPDSIGELRLRFHVRYVLDKVPKEIDTIAVMTRLTGKEKVMWNF